MTILGAPLPALYPLSSASTRWLRVCGGLLLGIGGVIILGWVADVPELRSFLPRNAEANMNAAVSLCLCGCGLLAWSGRSVLVARLVGGLLVTFNFLIQVETLTGWPAAINLLFWLQSDTLYLWVTGRVAPHAAMAFLLAGLAFAATGGRIVATLAKLLAQKGAGRGLISICAAGGQGVVAILEK